LGLKLGAIALCSLPVVAGWAVLSLALGRAQEKRSARRESSSTEVRREYSFDAAC
jgi:AAA family ATP:ADP antiporter